MSKPIQLPEGCWTYQVARLRSMHFSMIDGQAMLDDYKPNLIFHAKPAIALLCLSCQHKGVREEGCLFYTQEDLDEHVRMHQVLDA